MTADHRAKIFISPRTTDKQTLTVSASPPEYWGRRVAAASGLVPFLQIFGHFFISEKLRKLGILPGFRNFHFLPLFLPVFRNFSEQKEADSGKRAAFSELCETVYQLAEIILACNRSLSGTLSDFFLKFFQDFTQFRNFCAEIPGIWKVFQIFSQLSKIVQLRYKQ